MATNAVPIRPDFRAPAPRNQQHAFVLLRVLTGIDFFGHGYARTFTGTYLSGFAQSMQKSMATAPLSPDLVLIAGYIIPICELLIGACLILGIFTRGALTAAFGLMFLLMFGVTMKQDWNAAGQQMVYGLVLFVLLFTYDRYNLSWPNLIRRSRPIAPAPSVQ
jgi:thiosulfate dehydrogenase [quinone] large subunit